ncbi:MAG: hypothetical protein LQ344_007818 [Seirophora lacunosa]|nr:MAG: hypothetical protein LQ344_007818 [Seirophora lacunosa]
MVGSTLLNGDLAYTVPFRSDRISLRSRLLGLTPLPYPSSLDARGFANQFPSPLAGVKESVIIGSSHIRHSQSPGPTIDLNTWPVQPVSRAE